MPVDELKPHDVIALVRAVAPDVSAPSDDWAAEQRAHLVAFIQTGQVSPLPARRSPDAPLVGIDDVTRPERLPRVALLLGLVAAALLLVIGLVVLPSWDDAEAPASPPRVRGRSVVTMPADGISLPMPDRYPALAPGDPREAQVSARLVASVVSSPLRNAWVILGDVVSGELDGVVDVRAFAATLDEVRGFGQEERAEPVEVLGRPGVLLTSPDLSPRLLWQDGAVTFMLTADDPVGFLAGADVMPVAARIGSDGWPVLEVGELPIGYRVVAGPQPFVNGSVGARLAVPEASGSDDEIAVVVSRNDPFVEDFNVPVPIDPGELRLVDIGGLEGWAGAPDGAAIVIWKVSDTTWASVLHAADVDTALAFARSLGFVDRSTWTARYDVPDRYGPARPAAGETSTGGT